MNRNTAILLLALATGIVAWPKLIWDGEPLPDTRCLAIADALDRLGVVGRFFHDLKNLLTELFRCDPQWWAKFSSFTWSLEAIVIVALLAWVISLKWGRK